MLADLVATSSLRSLSAGRQMSARCRGYSHAGVLSQQVSGQVHGSEEKQVFDLAAGQKLPKKRFNCPKSPNKPAAVSV